MDGSAEKDQDGIYVNTTPSSQSVESSYHLTAAARAFLVVTMVLFSVTAILGNLTVILVVALTKKLHTIASLFLINLSISDFLVGAITMPFIADNVVNEKFVHGEICCQILAFLTVLCFINSVISLVAIAMDRYSAIINCLYYASSEHRRRAIAILVWTWLQALVCSCCPVFGWGRYDYIPARFACSVDWTVSPSFTLFILATCFVFPIIVLLVCYGRILRVARQHARRISDVHIQLGGSRHSLPPAPSAGGTSAASARDNIITPTSDDITNATEGNDNMSVTSMGTGAIDQNTSSLFRSKSRATRRLCLVISVFLICWMPYVLVNIYHMIAKLMQDAGGTGNASAATIATWMAVMSSSLNPLIYGFANRKFRSAIGRLCCKLLRKHLRTNRVEEIETISRRMSAANIPTWRSRSSSTASSLTSDCRTRSTRVPSIGGVSSFSAGSTSQSLDRATTLRRDRGLRDQDRCQDTKQKLWHGEHPGSQRRANFLTFRSQRTV
ncbi:5-hydroxytryptamine receptor 1D-like [Ptychodera flava]|uniref:5-hydroxytryptamine receptor 1D-like n=1 Tax=Ptychodera flava TaxID=63121 RepID=UPI00396AADF4